MYQHHHFRTNQTDCVPTLYRPYQGRLYSNTINSVPTRRIAYLHFNDRTN